MPPAAPDPIGEELASWGTVILLTTRGRHSGLPRTAAVGYVEEPDGSLLVSAGGPATDWALNLLAEPRCEAARDGLSGMYTARALTQDEHAATVAALILRYGTPAEGLGEGPSFRLAPERT